MRAVFPFLLQLPYLSYDAHVLFFSRSVTGKSNQMFMGRNPVFLSIILFGELNALIQRAREIVIVGDDRGHL